MTDLRPWVQHKPGCLRGKVAEPVTCPECSGRMLRVRNTSGYLNNEQFDAVKSGDWVCKGVSTFSPKAEKHAAVYVWDSALPKSPCTCGLDAAMIEPETWNDDLTTAPRDQPIRLKMPPYVVGSYPPYVGSVQPIAWAYPTRAELDARNGVEPTQLAPDTESQT